MGWDPTLEILVLLWRDGAAGPGVTACVCVSMDNLLKTSTLGICFPGISHLHSKPDIPSPLQLGHAAKALKTPRGCFLPGVWARALLKPH